eukprot:TRINITY_DN8103_c0_g1_i1.p1 TRINITY_DN8103_c0_g1~~TRINITY_DN8103_c0_g1_i1.p1  ORF type:complete len:557 (+),score=92.62 TRINITY_DN8103_c0_g1_i1:3-1673(+)
MKLLTPQQSFLLLVYVTLCLSSSCVVEKTQCIMDIQEFDCLILSGNYSHALTCEERNIGTGRCCVHDFCGIGSEFLCLGVIEGDWGNSGDCSECPKPSRSCCRNGLCEDNVPENECSGTSSERPCGTGYCVNELGACCSDTKNTCFDLPEIYCDGTWHRGESCNSTTHCYFPISDSMPSNSSTGRCCVLYSDSCSTLPEESCPGLYEHGLDCSYDYPCYPIGVCLRDGICLDKSYEGLCALTGGSFFSGGKCNNESTVACHYLGRCNYYPPSNCLTIGGQYGEEFGECENTTGACFSLQDGSCDFTENKKCAFFSEEFYPGYQCDGEEVDPKGHCCIYNFCERNIREQFCYIRGYENRVFYSNSSECPASGLCGSDSIKLDGIDISLNPVPISTVSVDINGSTIIFSTLDTKKSTFVIDHSVISSGDVNITSSSFSVFSSLLQFDALSLLNSTLILNPGSTLQIVNCLEISGSTIEIHISDEEEELFNGESSVTLASFSCDEVPDGFELQVTSARGNCYGADTTTNAIRLFSISCQSTGSSIIVSLTLIILMSFLN